MKAYFSSLLICSLMAVCPAHSQVAKTFYVPKAGTLVELMTEEEANEITHLTLTGKINAVDFRHLRDEFTSLQSLDISNAVITAYVGTDGTNSKLANLPNSIPAYAFCSVVDGKVQGKTTLREVVLSDKTRSIEEAAFKGCSNLRVCKMRKKTAPIIKNEALADSITAIFVPVGCASAYRNAKNWTSFGFVEGEPTEASVDLSDGKGLTTHLSALNMQPKDLNFLTITGYLDEPDFKIIRDFMPNLVSIDLSNCTSTVLPDYTFTQKRYLLTIKLPANLKTIGQRAFSGCGRLSGTLVLPPTVTAIEFGAFMGCDNLHTVIATGDKITTLGDSLFGEAPNKLVYKK